MSTPLRRIAEWLLAVMLLAGLGATAPGVRDLATALAPAPALAGCTATNITYAPDKNGYFTRSSVANGLTPAKLAAGAAFNGSATHYFWTVSLIRSWKAFSTYTVSNPDTVGTGTSSNCNNYFKYSAFNVGDNGKWGLFYNGRYLNNAGYGVQPDPLMYLWNNPSNTCTVNTDHRCKQSFTLTEGNYAVADQKLLHVPCTAVYNTAANLATAATGAAPGANCETVATDSTLSETTAFIYDVTPPTLTVAATAAVTNAAPVTFSLTDTSLNGSAGEALAPLNTATVTSGDFTITNGTFASAACAAGVCTVSVTPSGQGTVSLAPSGTFSVSDTAGNATVASFATVSTVYDTVAPVSSASFTSTHTNERTPALAWSASDATSAIASVSAYYSSSNFLSSPVLCGTLATSATSGTISCALPVSGGEGAYYVYTVAADSAGNAETAPLTADDSFVLDTVAPTVATFTSGSASPTNAATVAYSLTFSDATSAAVTGLASDDVANVGTATGCSFSISGAGLSYTVTATGCSDTGTVRPRLLANAVTDLAGNPGPAANVDATTTVTIDRVAPTISWTTPVSGTTYSSSTTLTAAWTATDEGSVISSLAIGRDRVSITTSGSCAGGTWTADTTSLTVTGTSILPVSGLASGSCYRWTLVAVDAAGNSTISTSGERLVDTSAPTLSITATGTGVYDAGSTVYFRAGTSGTLTLTAASSDAQSGVATVTFGALSAAGGWSPTPSLPNTDPSDPYVQVLAWDTSAGSATLTVSAVNQAGGSTAVSEGLVADGAAPAATVSSPAAFTRQTATTIDLTWSESDVSGVASRTIQRQVATPTAGFDCTGVAWSSDGAATVTVSPRQDTNLDTGCYRYAITLVDNVGNSGTTYTAAVLVDTTPPATATADTTGSASLLSGTTLFFRAGSAGSLTITVTSSDAVSGIASITFAGSAPSGWTGTPSLPAVDGTAPYELDLAWNGSAAGGWSLEITPTNGAGGTGSVTSLSVVADATGPVATISAPAGATIRSSGTITAAWTESDGAGSGLGSRSVQRERATIPAVGSCAGASFSADGEPTTAASPRADTGLAGGFCYRYAVTLVDAVGNSATTYSGTVLMDTSAPDAPSATASGTGVYQAGANATVWFRPSAAATITLLATAADGDSDIVALIFGALSAATGWNPAGQVTDVSAPYSTGYAFTAGAVATTLTVAARNGADAVGTATTISFSPETSAPLADIATPAPNSSITDGDGSYVVAWSESDPDTGIAWRSVARERVAVADGACPASGWTADGSPTTGASPRTDSGLASGYCYRWVVTLVDLVGNEAAATSGQVLVDSTAPDAPAVTATGTKVFQAGDVVWFGAGTGTITLVADAADAQSGIMSVTFGSLSSATGFTPATGLPFVDPTAPYSLALAFSGSAATSGLGIFATNGATIDSNSRTLALLPDRGDPVATSVVPAAFGIQSATSVTVSWTEGDADGSGVATRSVARQRAAIGASGSCSGVAWSSDGSATTEASPRTDTGLGSWCYRWAITLVDNVGNSATSYTAAVLVDTTGAAAPAVSAAGSGVFQESANGVVFFRPAAASTVVFTVTAADDESGIAAIRFGALSVATGWSPSNSYDAVGSPYQRSYAFTASAAATSLAIRAVNGAGEVGTTTTISLTPDTTGPGVTVTAPIAAAVQAGSSIAVSWNEDDDGGSGTASRVVVRYRAPIPATGSCAGADWTADGAPTTTTSPRTDSGLAGGACYRYGITATDRVGNTGGTAYSAAILVDDTAPDAPALTASAGTAGTVYAAANGTTWFAAAGAGSVTVTATAADSQSGVVSITFAALSGASGWTPAGAATLATNPAERTYTWSAGAAAATFSAVAVNGTGETGAAASLVLTPDAAAPTIAWTSPTPSTTNPSGTATTLIFAVTDSDSGLASSALQRQRAAVISGACPGAASFANDGPALVAPVSPIAIDNLLVDYCYRWVLTATDRVGQESSALSGTILVTSTFSLAGIPGEIEFAVGQPGDLVSASGFSATAVAASAYELRIEVGSMTRIGGVAGDLIPASAFRFIVNGSIHTPASGIVSITSGSGTGGAGTVYTITPRVLLPFVSAGTYSGEITFVLDGLGN